jgi:hypothetical protein
MLVYHPAFDIYHGVFRALLLLESTTSRAMPSETLRIIDLYFVFLYLLAEFEFPKGAGRKGRQLAGVPSRFNTLPAPRIFVTQMANARPAHAGRGRACRTWADSS